MTLVCGVGSDCLKGLLLRR